MWRQAGTVAAIIALLLGNGLAPYTHAHHSIATGDHDDHHGNTVLHAHAAPHAHHDVGSDEARPAVGDNDQEQVWSVDVFVAQPSSSHHLPSPIVASCPAPDDPLTSVWLGALRLRPAAHAPPVSSPPGLRAPPALLPAIS
jgi:hypothetical protein